MNDFKVTIEDHSNDVLRELEKQKETILKTWGGQGVSCVQEEIGKKIPRRSDSWYTSKGGAGLRGSISFQVDENESAVYVGSNSEIAYYNEFGTGKYHDTSDGKSGRSGWWVFVPGSSEHRIGGGKIYTEAEARQIVAILRSKGLDAHMTQGITPIHMFKNGIGDHIEEFQQIAETLLKK